MDELVNAEHHKSVQGHMNTEDIVFGYCTEFMVNLKDKKRAKKPFSEEEFPSGFESIWRFLTCHFG